MGAVVAKGKRVIAVGHNSRKTHPRYGSGVFKGVCAESAAIKKCVRQGIDLNGASIWVYRHGNRMARPCTHCMNLIISVGLKNIYYTDRNGKVQREKV